MHAHRLGEGTRTALEQTGTSAACSGLPLQAHARTVDGRVGVERARDALELAQHALARVRIRQYKVNCAHALRIQP